jgi:preprotein translocase subunit SecA
VISDEAEARLTGPEADPEGYITWVNATFPLGVTAKDFDFSAGAEEVAKATLQRVRDAYEIKIKFEDPNALESLERYTVLGSIDRLWQEHLYAIDALRQGIGLRAHAQRGDPLIDYKREAFTLFSDLMGRVKTQIAASLFRTSASITAFEAFLRNLPVKLVHEAPPSAFATPPQNPQEQPAPLPENAKAGEKAPVSTAPVERQLPIRHTGPQLNRNDVCPMGTGKKFKNCCGADGSTKFCTGAGLGK